MKHLITLMIISCSFIGLSQYTIYTKGYSDTYDNVNMDLETVFTISHDYTLFHMKNFKFDTTLEIVDTQTMDNTIRLICKDFLGDYCFVEINSVDMSLFIEFPNDENTEIEVTQLYMIAYAKEN